MGKTRILSFRARFVGDKATMQKLEKGGKLESFHNDGPSVFDYAAMAENPEVVRILRAAGEKPQR
jgi:hypothetical protein